jgi:hypothetical protein
MRPADVEDVDALQFRQLHELDAVRRLDLAHAAGRLAPRMRLELVLQPFFVHLARPWLERHVRQRHEVTTEGEDWHPDPLAAGGRSGKQHPPAR